MRADYVIVFFYRRLYIPGHDSTYFSIGIIVRIVIVGVERSLLRLGRSNRIQFTITGGY